MKKSFFMLAVALVFGLSGCAPAEVTTNPDGGGGGTGQEQGAPSSAKVGDKITLKGMDDNLKVAITVLKPPKTVKATDGFKPSEKGNRFVAVQISLENVGTVVYDDSLLTSSVLLDADGQEYNTTILTKISAGPIVDNLKMAPGKKRKGWVVFEMPKKVKPAGLQITLDSGMGPQTGEWKLN
ncbi:uncharacterized protein DUF4352 [Actinocorallia herbida]|uniref:Uncharacterized protein DUF4352 n=1 Tax=Actinocorallia herbida TaxID=58109 RepID=A0A3N1CW09_9ACTN|nr:DUF4352 domain-containing protein [Actinocorallia herbida]ROO85470.1 uncharacterized protein DUF4352 [Actinocorallia herbida]